ncbi:MAG: hypothetical protein ACKO7Z_07340 [Cyanobacteriota bacterium]
MAKHSAGQAMISVLRACRPGALKMIVFLMIVLLVDSGCALRSSDFESFMRISLPSQVKVDKMDGNWGKDPWRCWELSPVNEELKQNLIALWSLKPDAQAFNGVASGGRLYCQIHGLEESYSGSSDSYRAVGIKAGKMFVYFYNG